MIWPDHKKISFVSAPITHQTSSIPIPNPTRPLAQPLVCFDSVCGCACAAATALAHHLASNLTAAASPNLAIKQSSKHADSPCLWHAAAHTAFSDCGADEQAMCVTPLTREPSQQTQQQPARSDAMSCKAATEGQQQQSDNRAATQQQGAAQQSRSRQAEWFSARTVARRAGVCGAVVCHTA